MIGIHYHHPYSQTSSHSLVFLRQPFWRLRFPSLRADVIACAQYHVWMIPGGSSDPVLARFPDWVLASFSSGS